MIGLDSPVVAVLGDNAKKRKGIEERLGLRTQLWFLHENQTTDGRLELGDASRQIDFAMALTVAP